MLNAHVDSHRCRTSNRMPDTSWESTGYCRLKRQEAAQDAVEQIRPGSAQTNVEQSRAGAAQTTVYRRDQGQRSLL